jgi:hypothetical protein
MTTEEDQVKEKIKQELDKLGDEPKFSEKLEIKSIQKWKNMLMLYGTPMFK